MKTEHLRRLKTVELPGQPLAKFDIGWVDEATRRYYLADRSNARIAVLDVDSLEYVNGLAEGQFTGVAAVGGATSVPNRVLVLPDLQQVWAGDGNSTVKIVDVKTGELVDSVSTHGINRVDELAYDGQGVVLVANDREAVPFVTLISTASDHAIIAKLDLPRASNGLHQPVWDRNNELFYLPVTEVDRIKANGEIAAIDRSGRLVASYPVDECQPAGLTIGPDGDLCIGCSSGAVKAGFRVRSLIMQLQTGAVVTTIMDVGGSDEVWYNSGDERYYLAAHAMPDGPVLGVIDAKRRSFVENVETGPDAHSVAADARTNRIFVPIGPTAAHPRGGVAIYQRG